MAERVAYLVSAPLLAVIVAVLAEAQDWERGSPGLAVIVAAVLFGAIATPLLLGRRTRT